MFPQRGGTRRPPGRTASSLANGGYAQKGRFAAEPLEKQPLRLTQLPVPKLTRSPNQPPTDELARKNHEGHEEHKDFGAGVSRMVVLSVPFAVFYLRLFMVEAAQKSAQR